jgi:hypothetical protein
MTRRFVGILVCVAACNGGGGGGGDDGDDDGGGDTDASVDAATHEECERPWAPESRLRYGVVSFPYAANRDPARTYRVFTVDTSGALALTGTTFEMGRSTIGKIAFSADGELGFVAQEDGTLGVFRVSATGEVEVLYAGYRGSFYAEQVFFPPAGGKYLYVIDPNTRANGGGVYWLEINCDDSINELGALIPVSGPSEPVYDTAGKLLVATRDVGLPAPAGQDVHLLDVAGGVTRLDGVDAFGDDDAMVSGVAMTAEHRYALFGDSQQIANTPNRIAVVESLPLASSLAATQVITPVEDPLSIVMSPHNDVALVVSGFGDAFLALDYDASSSTAPFSLRGPITYTGARPELPGPAVMIERGALRGMVLVPENLGIRRLRFAPDRVITDLGKTATGASGFENITGALGIQP